MFRLLKWLDSKINFNIFWAKFKNLKEFLNKKESIRFK